MSSCKRYIRLSTGIRTEWTIRNHYVRAERRLTCSMPALVTRPRLRLTRSIPDRLALFTFSSYHTFFPQRWQARVRRGCSHDGRIDHSRGHVRQVPNKLVFAMRREACKARGRVKQDTLELRRLSLSLPPLSESLILSSLIYLSVKAVDNHGPRCKQRKRILPWPLAASSTISVPASRAAYTQPSISPRIWSVCTQYY